MLISEAQADVRRVYEGGFYGQLVSGAVWLVAAALGSWVSTAAGIVSLMVGGALIFPLTTLVLKATGQTWHCLPTTRWRPWPPRSPSPFPSDW